MVRAMKRALRTALIGVVRFAFRAAVLGRFLAKGCAHCERMMARMPESFPPRRMMTDLATLRHQTAGILELLERRERDAGSRPDSGAGTGTPAPRPPVSSRV